MSTDDAKVAGGAGGGVGGGGGGGGGGDGGGGGGGRGSVQTEADQSHPGPTHPGPWCIVKGTSRCKYATLFHAKYSSCLLHASEASAESTNMSVMAGALETSQAEMPGWLKAVALLDPGFTAPLNIHTMFVTLLVSHASGRLNS